MSKRLSGSAAVTALVEAAEAARDAFARCWPDVCGTPHGAALDGAMDALHAAARAVKFHPAAGYCPTLEVLVRRVRSPGGRGRNAVHWEATTGPAAGDGAEWLVRAVRGNSKDLVVGKLVRRHRALGEPPPRVVIRYVTE